jgi:hypothetical protein
MDANHPRMRIQIRLATKLRAGGRRPNPVIKSTRSKPPRALRHAFVSPPPALCNRVQRSRRVTPAEGHLLRQPDELSIAELHFRALSEGIFEVTITQNGADLTREAFSRVNAVVFFTAINPPGPDIDALLAWVRAGGAFVGIHSTANTYQRIPAFGELLGARYDRRPWRTTQAPQTTVRITVLDRTHPATRHPAQVSKSPTTFTSSRISITRTSKSCSVSIHRVSI